jgi:hypothetical protein
MIKNRSNCVILGFSQTKKIEYFQFDNQCTNENRIMKKYIHSLSVKKLLLILIFPFILLIGIISCEKKQELSFSFKVMDLVYFPDNEIYMSFKIIPQGGNPPYFIKWFEPATFLGEGPFSVKLIDDLILDFELEDSENKITRLSHKILKDTIDSLKYDYRNMYIGSYSCDVKYSYIDSIRYYHDTLTVAKMSGFKNLLITNKHNNWSMDYSSLNQFYGYHRGLSFRNDSIFFSESGPLGAYYTNTYKGIKIK